jgi:hypothetical protein
MATGTHIDVGVFAAPKNEGHMIAQRNIRRLICFARRAWLFIIHNWRFLLPIGTPVYLAAFTSMTATEAKAAPIQELQDFIQEGKDFRNTFEEASETQAWQVLKSRCVGKYFAHGKVIR